MTSTRHLTALVLFVALAAGARTADAESFHEKVEARPINKAGAVVGLRLILTLRPDGTQKKVLVGLGKPSSSYSSTNYRTAATDPKQGYLVHQWPEVELDGKNPKEVTLEVLFADAPGLQAGTDIDVVTAWTGGSAVHVWGMKRSGVTGTQVKVPGTTPPAASAGHASTARTARRVSHTQRRAQMRRQHARARRARR
ncbi:MAG TPA: hypothetical protein VMZ28_25035 [Kofleriaceae bacterium]|nr:hypothetical protein [Kofleriaceae bacterium]